MNAFDFYNANKNNLWNMPPIPSNLTTAEEKTKWIMFSGFGWIELDISIDINSWKQEAEYSKSHLVYHREGDDHNGWRSCCIHGIDIDKTGIWNKYAETEPEYSWTALSDKTPSIKKYWQEFPFEKLARVRFMEVAPSGFVSPHQDIDISLLPSNYNIFDNIMPINIAITHPSDCYMTLENSGIVPWQDGKVFLVNISQYHSVINFSNQPRLHIIGHGIPGNQKDTFCELIVRSYNKQYEAFQSRL